MGPMELLAEYLLAALLGGAGYYFHRPGKKGKGGGKGNGGGNGKGKGSDAASQARAQARAQAKAQADYKKRLVKLLKTMGLKLEQFEGMNSQQCREVINAAWKEKARAYHPDKNLKRQKWAHTQMSKVNAARDELLGMLKD